MPPNLTPLNPSQLEAVTAADNSTLIIAGPGTGKTFTLAYRIAYLISECGVNPERILAVTFTRKASQEMKERVVKLVGSHESKIRSQKTGVRSQKIDESLLPTLDPRIAAYDSGLTICTFHSLGLTILREEGHRMGLRPDFRILSESEQVELVKDILSEIMPQEPLNRARKWVQRISEKKNLAFMPPHPSPLSPLAEGGLDGGVNKSSSPELSCDFSEAIFSTYENQLRALNLIDFDDLILKPLRIFRENLGNKGKYQNRFHHILVDEYQDINNVQYLLLKELCGVHTSLWVIGDADQAIYAFRGANVEYFLKFKQDHPGIRTISLERNYRSTATILSGAQGLISKNINRIPHNLIPLTPGGPPVYLFPASDHWTEARFVVKEIERLIGGTRMESSFEVPETFAFGEIAVLYRLHTLAHSFSEALKESGIPYQIVGGPSSYSDSLLEYVISCLKVVVNPHDDLSFRTALPLMDKRFESREAFLSLVHRFQNESRTISLEKLIKNILQELKLEEENLSGWLIMAQPFCEGSAIQQLPRFLETLSLLKEGETYNPRVEAVTLMTLHAAKGLEFPVVFMVGLESGILPCTEFGEEPGDPEEERRLFYVGMTRAKQRLYLSYSRNRYLFGENRNGTPSPFISEISEEVMETLSADFGKNANKKPKVKQLKLFL